MDDEKIKLIKVLLQTPDWAIARKFEALYAAHDAIKELLENIEGKNDKEYNI